MMDRMEKRIQLIFLPFAGGDGNSFRQLTELLNPRIECFTVAYSGRGKRRQEPLFTEYVPFIRDVERQIQEVRKPELPFAVLGYSAGGVFTYDLLSRGVIEGKLLHTFICSKGRISGDVPSSHWWELSDEEFAQYMRHLGGIDERILRDERFRAIYLKPIKADYRVYDEYVFCPGKIPSDITCIYSPKDEIADGVVDWKQLTDGNVDFYPMGENHFFIYYHWEDVAKIINSKLNKYLA